MDFVGRFQQPVEGGFLVEIPHLFIRVFEYMPGGWFGISWVFLLKCFSFWPNFI